MKNNTYLCRFPNKSNIFKTHLNKHSIDTSINELLSLIDLSNVFINHVICFIIVFAGLVRFCSYSIVVKNIILNNILILSKN